jgi:hypothetical protein
MTPSVAGKAEGVARIVRGVVDCGWVGEAGAQNDENAEGEGERGGPARE